ncbi:MAG TPA: alpha-glucan phosphorylase, partial [Ruminococcaceae bacterium]|nr:alpha-glucan phosphorylase [Oscillospiraceae bacterium]
MEYKQSVQQIKKGILAKLDHNYGVGLENATNDQLYKSVALMAREMMEQGRSEFMAEAEKQNAKQVYYLCMEFLLGRSLKNTLFNLGIEGRFRDALKQMDVKLDALYDCEPDAGLGNGGLGRLAACFMDALATGRYPATGYSLCYEYGIFRQKLVDGWQTELPDFWLPGGRIWMREIPE